MVCLKKLSNYLHLLIVMSMIIGCSQAPATFCRKKSCSNLQPTALPLRCHGIKRKSVYHGKNINENELFVLRVLAEK